VARVHIEDRSKTIAHTHILVDDQIDAEWEQKAAGKGGGNDLHPEEDNISISFHT
jgi:hypothetical protein